MSKEPILTVQGVSKRFYFFSSPWKRLGWALGLIRPERWFSALEDISFSLKKGESLGVIGNNGSGKSTLLKVVAGITPPSQGKIEVRGRLASLIELGVGFHSELTGRENILLNALFVGLGEKELPEKVRFIEEFSELGEFFDRPVKIYSTGMYMRLAFSLAVAVDPEILVVDEALSVGDQRFQKKCIDYICDLRRRGITLLFCSHDLYQVELLCERCLWLKEGRMAKLGPTREVISAYHQYLQQKKEEEAFTFSDAPVVIEKIEPLDEAGFQKHLFSPKDPLRLRVHYRSLSEVPLKVHFGLGLYGVDQTEIFACASHLKGHPPLEIPPRGKGTVSLFFPKVRLLDGVYSATGVIFDEKGLLVYHRYGEKNCLRVLSQKFEVRGLVYLDHEWEW